MSEMFYHLAEQTLEIGSVILPGNYGRIIRRAGWAHPCAMREMALESCRVKDFPHRPSRLEAAYVFLTPEEANRFRLAVPGFAYHCLYGVSLREPDALSFVTDHRLVSPQGNLRADWCGSYWMGVDPEGVPIHIPGAKPLEVREFALSGPYREMVTMSALIIEEIFEPKDPLQAL